VQTRGFGANKAVYKALARQYLWVAWTFPNRDFGSLCPGSNPGGVVSFHCQWQGFSGLVNYTWQNVCSL
jgi:hypothetical protein